MRQERLFALITRVAISCAVAIFVLCSCVTTPTAPAPVTPATSAPPEPGPPPSYGPQVCAFSETTVYEAVAAALARMEEPELRFLDRAVIVCAFLRAFDGGDVKDEWLAIFAARVHELSRGTIRLERADPATFSHRLKGEAAYLALTRGDVTRRITLGPYAYPVMFFD